MEKIGQGGTNDVFKYPNEDFVIKLNRDILQKLLDANRENISIDFREKVEEYIKIENAKNEQLYECFGKENCLCERVIMKEISIEKDNIIQNIEGIISIQEASNIFKESTKKDFSVGYVEQSPKFEKNKETYDQMNKSLLGNEKFNEKDFLEFNDKMKPIFELLDNDEEFSDCMKDFLLKFKNYFEISGRFIDLIGEENVLFYKENEKWTFKLGSVIKEETENMMHEVMNILEENPEKINKDESQEFKKQLMNQLALIRLLNSTSIKIGIGKIINTSITEKQLNNLHKIKFDCE